MKRTLENCKLAKKYEPYKRNGRCTGVGKCGYEPVEQCQKCKLYDSYYEDREFYKREQKKLEAKDEN